MNGILESKGFTTFSVGGVAVPAAAVVEAKALPGDIVQLDAVGTTIAEILDRAAHRGIVGILEVASKTKYGFTSRGAPLYLFQPWDTAYPAFVVGTSSELKYGKTNVLAVVDFESWTGHLPRANCVRVLGAAGDLAVEEEALLLHACPHRWTRKWLEPVQPRAAGPVAAQSRVAGRTFHVDPPGCKDVDDAITFWPTGDEDRLEVHIHIADVATLLATNPWLWRAAAIGQSYYRDGAVVLGMFPAEVEAACSLLPFVERPTVTLAFVWDMESQMVIGAPWWLHEVVEIKESYTYESIVDSDLAPVLRNLATGLANGAPRPDSHDWIAELMLFYNREAAKVLRGRGEGLLRRHSEPDMVRLAVANRAGAPAHIAYAAGETCEAMAAETTHWGLGTGLYCHASSPIRRWTDCINQMALLRALGWSGPLPAAAPAALNRTAKRAKAYERDLFFVRTVLRPGAGVEFDATVLDDCDTVAHLWVPSWERIVKARAPVGGFGRLLIAGEQIRVSVFVDATKRAWKQRVVFRLNTDAMAN